MIAVDSSALLAVMLREPDGVRYRDALLAANGDAATSVAQVLEVSIKLLNRFGEVGEAKLPDLLAALNVAIADIDAEQLHEARRAYRQFGKGRHPAGLNYGDCFAYALSKTNNWPLLFKGDDFSKTDVEPASLTA
jgi:ribonuclease VapC